MLGGLCPNYAVNLLSDLPMRNHCMSIENAFSTSFEKNRYTTDFCPLAFEPLALRRLCVISSNFYMVLQFIKFIYTKIYIIVESIQNDIVTR